MGRWCIRIGLRICRQKRVRLFPENILSVKKIKNPRKTILYNTICEWPSNKTWTKVTRVILKLTLLWLRWNILKYKLYLCLFPKHQTTNWPTQRAFQPLGDHIWGRIDIQFRTPIFVIQLFYKLQTFQIV